jgi:hypothetical protein
LIGSESSMGSGSVLHVEGRPGFPGQFSATMSNESSGQYRPNLVTSLSYES